MFVFFPRTGNMHNDANMQLDTKSNQWFGATVASAGIDGPVVVSYLHMCVRFVRFVMTPNIDPNPTLF